MWSQGNSLCGTAQVERILFFPSLDLFCPLISVDRRILVAFKSVNSPENQPLHAHVSDNDMRGWRLCMSIYLKLDKKKKRNTVCRVYTGFLRRLHMCQWMQDRPVDLMPQGMTKAMQFCACADRSTLDFDHDARCKPIVNYWRWKREKIGKKALQNWQNVEQVCGFPAVSTHSWQLPHCDIWSVTLSDAGRLRISSAAIIRWQELTMLVKNSELKRIMIRSTNILITITNTEACYSTWRMAMVPDRPTAGRSRDL